MRKLFVSLLIIAIFAVLPGGAVWGQSSEVDDRPMVYFKGGKINFGYPDQDFHLRLDNRLYLDAGFHFPHFQTDDKLTYNEDPFLFSNGINFRRARIAFKARIYRNWVAEMDYDFSFNEVTIKDFFIGYRIGDFGLVKFGQFKEPMSIESTTSSQYLVLPERPMAVDALNTSRTIGLSTIWWGKHWWTSVGVFTQEMDDYLKDRNRGHTGYAFTGRLATVPVNNDMFTLHLGAYGTYRTPDANGESHRGLKIRSYPESRVDRHRFLSLGFDHVNHSIVGGIELGMRIERFLLQGEFIVNSISRYELDPVDGRRIAMPDVLVGGWYATASYAILGGHRSYNNAEAEFKQLSARDRWGVLELAARVSALRLNDTRAKDQYYHVHGGEAMVFSGGVNYLPIPNLKLTLAYLYSMHDGYADEGGKIEYDGKPLREHFSTGFSHSTLLFRAMVTF